MPLSSIEWKTGLWRKDCLDKEHLRERVACAFEGYTQIRGIVCWMIETNLIRSEDNKYIESQVFPEIVSALIDDARRFGFEKKGNFF